MALGIQIPMLPFLSVGPPRDANTPARPSETCKDKDKKKKEVYAAMPCSRCENPKKKNKSLP